MFALVDVNSFYASCEALFRPDLHGKPIVVLSNNDGCVIARSAEAKQLGVTMGAPYFKQRRLFEQYGVHVFSSNYSLYGDMSQRVMLLLEAMVPRVEVYSIDEAFMDVTDYLGLYHMTIPQLCQIRGIGEVKAVQLKCIAELSRRIAGQSAWSALNFKDAASIADYFMEEMRHLEQEQMILTAEKHLRLFRRRFAENTESSGKE